MYRLVSGIVLGLTVGGLAVWFCDSSYGARLWPATREIVVREVANGYVVEAHTANNPYPYKEYVFTDRSAVGSAVAGLLNERIPSPLWGK